jgi:hypothetical protein
MARVWDNGGKTMDRYTIEIEGMPGCVLCSHNPFSPQGVYMHVALDPSMAHPLYLGVELPEEKWPDIIEKIVNNERGLNDYKTQ